MHLCITRPQWVKVNYSIPTLCILEWNNRVIMGVYRPWDQSKCVPIQWEILLQCNDNSHWLGAHLDWSLPRYIMIHLIQYNTTWAKSDHTHFVYIIHVMMSWQGNVSTLLTLCEGNLLVTGGFPSQRASDAELWYFFWCQPKQTAEWKLKREVYGEVLTLFKCNCNDINVYILNLWKSIHILSSWTMYDISVMSTSGQTDHKILRAYCEKWVGPQYGKLKEKASQRKPTKSTWKPFISERTQTITGIVGDGSHFGKTGLGRVS